MHAEAGVQETAALALRGFCLLDRPCRDDVRGLYYFPSRKGGVSCLSHDQNGNMTERGTSYAFDGDDPIYEHDDYYRAYEYDLQNRLVKVSGYIDGVLTTLATYGYSGDNLRLTKTAGGETTRYVHGVDGNELYRSTASDSVSTIWLFGRKLVEIEKTSGTETRTYLHTDHLGSVVASTDEAGATIWLGDNSAFGVATADVGLESRTASYTGKDNDEEAGLFYFNARWYDAELGRFTTEDPARDDINWYVYCANRPMTSTDPSGLRPIDEDQVEIRKTLNAEQAKERSAQADATRSEAMNARGQSAIDPESVGTESTEYEVTDCATLLGGKISEASPTSPWLKDVANGINIVAGQAITAISGKELMATGSGLSLQPAFPGDVQDARVATLIEASLAVIGINRAYATS